MICELLKSVIFVQVVLQSVICRKTYTKTLEKVQRSFIKLFGNSIQYLRYFWCRYSVYL